MSYLSNLYTLDDIAESLHVTKRTLYTYVKAGKLKAVKIGKYWRVTESNLQDFLTNGSPVLDCNRRKENQRGGQFNM